ncbi:MAG TPA: hypothetical protein VF516_12485 [Kofleriaceae bacterium]
MSYQYFTIPISSVPDAPPYTVWFATWSADQCSFVWSTTRPVAGAAGTTPTYVCGATDCAAPAGATVIIQNSAKTLPPPPVAVSSTASETEFQTALKQQLINTLDGLRSL